MDYILFFVLTNILFVGILFIYKKNKYKSIEYTQSNIHQIVKHQALMEQINGKLEVQGDKK
jgi:cell division protein FtsW (lipid II flippase)